MVAGCSKKWDRQRHLSFCTDFIQEGNILFKLFKSDNFKGLSGIWPGADIGDSACACAASGSLSLRPVLVSGGDIVHLVLWDTSSANMKRALFGKVRNVIKDSSTKTAFSSFHGMVKSVQSYHETNPVHPLWFQELQHLIILISNTPVQTQAHMCSALLFIPEYCDLISVYNTEALAEVDHKSWEMTLFSCEEAALEGQMLVWLSVCVSPKLSFTFHLSNVNL